ncbi:MAG: 50S ribosomal protein L3 N(5)-glutamine methyltransferase [Pseudomonadota bacterium]
MVENPSENGSSGEPAEITVGAALDSIHNLFENDELFFGHGTDNAWDESVALVLHAAGLAADAGDEVLEIELRPDQWARIQELAKRRAEERIPLPYLLGRAWFAGLPFLCDSRAIVPRSPLAEVITHEFKPWWGGESLTSVLDLCCGGGCIGIAAAVYNPEVTVTLADLDTDALALARENVAEHSVERRVRLVESDLFEAFSPQRFDVILCNPPYVNARDLKSMPDEYRFEPAQALGSGDDGLQLARSILAVAAEFLNEGGVLFLELGNSWVELDAELSQYLLCWLELAEGGHGVLVCDRSQLLTLAAHYNRSSIKP